MLQLQMLDCSDTESQCGQGQDNAVSELVAALSCQAVNGSEYSKALKLLGHWEGQEVRLLIDSGSSSSFINSKLVTDKQVTELLPQKLTVKVADGGSWLALIMFPHVNGCRKATNSLEI